MKKKNFILFLFLSTYSLYSQVHSLSTELANYYDLKLLPNYADHSISAQVSSYDTTGGNDDGFSGRYSYIRRNADSTLVLFDIHGNGVVNRIWTPTPSEDTLDFYIDTELYPTFSIQYLDLFSGKQYPFVPPLCGNQLGGYYCYLPIPFAKNCKIVYRGKKTQFHQIEYRLYSPGEAVIPFNPILTEIEKSDMKKIESLWNKQQRSISDFYSSSVMTASKQIQLSPGGTYSIFNSIRGGRILGLEIDPASSLESIYKNIDLKITWDGEPYPAVYCPITDFFGYAFGKVSMQSLLLGSQANKNYCYIPMPFDRSAKIELVYRLISDIKNPAIKLNTRIYSTPLKRDPLKEGKFYTQWNSKPVLPSGMPHLLSSVRGKGHYIGTILQAQGLTPGMTYFFEGDDSTVIDGQLRLHGTGSEDYFNGGWYALMDRWDGPMSLPLHGALDYSLPFCRTGGYRFYLADKLSFGQSFQHSIEHGPTGNSILADYTSLGLYYCNTPPSMILSPANTLSTVYLPDTMIIYPQLMDYTLYGNVDIKTSWKYGTGGESYLFTPGTESAVRISLRDIPHGRYSLYFDINQSITGCDFSVWQRQLKISDWISTKSDPETRVKDLFIRDIRVSDFENTLTLRFKTTSDKTGFLLHRLKLVKK